jgi:hypothetical protein
MADMASRQLVSYIAPAAPATRRPASGDEPFLRPEVGFTPRWYRQTLDFDFGEHWHTDPSYRLYAAAAMRRELDHRFPNLGIGVGGRHDGPPDLLTGAFGGCLVAGIYSVPIRYAPDNWPVCEARYLTAEEVDRLKPPDLGSNVLFCELIGQLDRIAREFGRIEGYLNWQGVLNNAYRLRGEDLFADMLLEPGRALHLFECVAATMTEGARGVYAHQRPTGVNVRHFTVSNCLVNMVSPEQYRELLLPLDRRMAEGFGLIGIHNCAWNANPYLEHYATVPNVGYIDMGVESDLKTARRLFPDARRAVMYTPMDLATKAMSEVEADFERIARDYGPCDIVLADIDAGTPDERVLQAAEMCVKVGSKVQGSGFRDQEGAQ